VLDHEQADRALAELGAESDRMADALLAMDSHPGHRLLTGTTLTGLTQRRWAEASTAMTVLWEQFGLHRSLVEQAREVRARKSRPGPAELTELTTLLTGPVAELNAEQLPIERRGLTGPAQATDRITLTDLVARMKASYSAITEVLAAAEKAWDTTVERLDPLDIQLHLAKALAESLAVEDPALDRIADELGEIRRSALADPLAVDADPPESLSAALSAARAELDKLVAARDSFEDRRTQLEARITEVAEVEAEARSVHATVLEKIASPGLASQGNPLSTLRSRIGELPELWRTQRWKALSRAMDDLDRDADQALTDVRTRLGALTGLLDRRLELRGRLDAYQAKAKRLGYVEDLDLGALHQKARELLYTIPCDLRAATVAVNRYQQALQERRGDR
jgi:hypothetical protein